MYEKLLISAGGGIISRDQQAEQDECTTIAIGLGGTGISCLRSLKKEIFTRVKPDPGSSPAPKYKHIKFLAVDTDRSSIGSTGAVDAIDGNTEFFNISCADISGLLEKAHILQQDSSLQWLKTKNTQDNRGGIRILSAEAGAGGVRQIGRLLLLRSCGAFVRKLTDIITEARKDLMGNPNINIHIFTGLGGGTGSGTFLDVCYIIQYVLSQMGLAGQAFTCGYFFMPDVNIAKGITNEYIPLNGFAAMKELDYAMNYDNNGGEWDQQYDGFRVKTSKPPVKLAHLITSTNAQGAIRTNGYEYAMHVAVDYVLEYIIKPYIADGDDTDNDGVFSIKSHISNVNRLIETVQKKHGACYDYCVIGAANAYLPYKEITTYLTSKIFEGFGRLNQQLPFDNDIDAFVIKCGLKYEEMMRTLNDRVPMVPNYAVDQNELYDQVEGMTPDKIPPLLAQIRDATSAISGKLAENKTAMLDTKAAPVTNGGRQIFSLYAKTKKELSELAATPDKGPFYASAILHNLNSRDLSNKISGYITQNSENLLKANADLSLREQSIANTLRELQNSHKIGRKGKAQDYVSSVRAYYSQLAKIELLQVLGEVLSEFNRQLDELYSGFFGIFANVMKNLQATFDVNLKSLAEPIVADNSYAIKLMSIQDLQESLDRSVENMRIDDLIRGFIETMLRNPDGWITQDESKICVAVTDYFLSQLSEYTRKTIVDYLQIKFDTTDQTLLQRRVYEDIIMPLGESSAPLFWTDNSVYSLDDAKPLGYLSIPNISDEIKAAANEYKIGHGGIDIRKAWAQDRITIFRFGCGIPMFGYKGVNNYKSEYKTRVNSIGVGSHLYEGSVKDPRDSRKLINISPFSCISADALNPEEKENAELYQKAWDCGIMTRVPIGDGYEYRLNIFDTDAIAAKKEAAEAVIKNGDTAGAAALLGGSGGHVLDAKTYHVIPNNGYADFAEIVIRDHVLGSELYTKILREQIKLLEDWRGTEDALKSLSSKAKAFDTDVHSYALALATGAVKKLNDYTYSYVKETFGLQEFKDLTTIETEPYGMSLPLYSSFLGYCALDGALKAEISAAVKTHLVNDREGVDAALGETLASLGKDRVNALANMARTTYSDDADAITSFLTRLVTEINNFAASR